MNKVLKKIAKKLLPILPVPQAAWMVGKVLKFYELVQVEKELDTLSRKQEVCLNFTHYLPDTEERIERLRRVINKRPVAIILHGPSAKELEERITELEDCDICYFSLNAFWLPEKHVLQKINRNLSVVMFSASPILDTYMNVYTQINDIIDYLDRQEENIFISEGTSFHRRNIPRGFDLDKFIKKYDKRLLFFISTFTSITMRGGVFFQLPSINYPLHFPGQSSFSILLSMAVIGEAPLVVIFGGDGGRINGQELYFKERGSNVPPESVLEHSIVADTRLFNITMPLILEKIYKIYHLRPVDIINCSERSHYTPLKKLSYDETFALLKSFKKDTGSTR